MEMSKSPPQEDRSRPRRRSRRAAPVAALVLSLGVHAVLVWTLAGVRVRATALAVLSLEVYYRYLPIYRGK